MTALLQVQNLCKTYPGFALTDVSFTLRPGRIMGLIGKNGADAAHTASLNAPAGSQNTQTVPPPPHRQRLLQKPPDQYTASAVLSPDL